MITFKPRTPAWRMLVFLLLLIPSGSGFSQSTSASLHESISQKLKTNTIIEGNFIQKKILSGFPRPITSTGTFFYWKNNGLYWETIKPFSHATTFMTKEVLHWKAGKKISDNDKKTDDSQRYISQILLAIFNGDLSGLAHYFDIAWQGSEKNWSIHLKPSNSVVKKTLSEITLTGIDYIENLEIKSANGDNTFISFNNIYPLDSPPQSVCHYFLNPKTSSCGQ